MDTLYKGLLKNYSVQLSDNYSSKMEPVENIYNKIFNALETKKLEKILLKEICFKKEQDIMIYMRFHKL